MLGSALNIHVASPAYTGLTVPSFTQNLGAHTPDLAKLTKYIDASAVLNNNEIRVAIVNRSDTNSFRVPISFGPNVRVKNNIVVFEVWDEDIHAKNSFDQPEKVKTIIKEVSDFDGIYALKAHSFQGMLHTLFTLHVLIFDSYYIHFDAIKHILCL